MSVHKVTGVVASLELSRGMNSLFCVDYVTPTDVRVMLADPLSASPSSPPCAINNLPLIQLVQRQLISSPGVIVKAGQPIGWRRKSDAIAAVEEAGRLLGRVTAAVASAHRSLDKESEEGVSIWFSVRQLRVLSELVNLGEEHIDALAASSQDVRDVLDRVDSACRYVASVKRRKGAPRR